MIVSMDGQPIDSMAVLALSLRDYDAGAIGGPRRTSATVRRTTPRPCWSSDPVASWLAGRPLGRRRSATGGPGARARRTPGAGATASTRRRRTPAVGQRQLLLALRAEHRPPPGLGAGHVGLLVGVARRASRRPSAGRWRRATGRRCTAAAPAGSDRAGSASGRGPAAGPPCTGMAGRGATPLSSRTTSPGIQPSGATLHGPVEARRGAPRRRPTARSSRCTNWRGGSSSERAHAGGRGQRPGHARSTRLGRGRCTGRSDRRRRGPGRRPPTSPAAARRRARCDGVAAARRSGRSGASSVSGTGLFGHAP